jgi:hypothetical protein
MSVPPTDLYLGRLFNSLLRRPTSRTQSIVSGCFSHQPSVLEGPSLIQSGYICSIHGMNSRPVHTNLFRGMAKTIIVYDHGHGDRSPSWQTGHPRIYAPLPKGQKKGKVGCHLVRIESRLVGIVAPASLNPAA